MEGEATLSILYKTIATVPWPLQLLIFGLLTVTACVVWWNLVILQNKLTRIDFHLHIWPKISENPMAVAFYRVGIMACLAYLVDGQLSRFG